MTDIRTKDEHEKVQAAIKASFDEMIAPLRNGSGQVPYDSDRFHAWAARNNAHMRRVKNQVSILYYDAGFVYRLTLLVVLPAGVR